DAYPEMVGDLEDLQAPRVGETPPDGVVDRSSEGLHARDQIDVDDELPERGFHVVVECVEVDHLDGVRRDAARPVVPDAVPREPDSRATAGAGGRRQRGVPPGDRPPAPRSHTPGGGGGAAPPPRPPPRGPPAPPPPGEGRGGGGGGRRQTGGEEHRAQTPTE